MARLEFLDQQCTIRVKQTRSEQNYPLHRSSFRVTVPHEGVALLSRIQQLANPVVEIGGIAYYEAKYWAHISITVLPTGGMKEETHDIITYHAAQPATQQQPLLSSFRGKFLTIADSTEAHRGLRQLAQATQIEEHRWRKAYTYTSQRIMEGTGWLGFAQTTAIYSVSQDGEGDNILQLAGVGARTAAYLQRRPRESLPRSAARFS